MLIISAEVKPIIYFHNTALLHNWTGTLDDMKNHIYINIYEGLEEEKKWLMRKDLT